MMGKRLFSIILSVFLIIGLCTPITIVNAGSVSTKISVESVEAEPGSQVDVNVRISGNTGILGATLELKYDDALTLVDAENGAAWNKLTMTAPGSFKSSGCNFLWDAESLKKEDIKDGNILKLTFKVAESANNNTSLPIYISAQKNSIFNQNLESVDVAFESGAINVKKQESAATKIKVDNSTGYSGENVSVPVLIEGNTGIAGFSLDVEYDENVLIFQSAEQGDVTSKGAFSQSDNTINWYTDKNNNSDGSIMLLTFSVLDTAEDGDTTVRVKLHNNKKNLVDENGTFVEADYLEGTITIRSGLLGDVNGDDDVTIADVVLLNRAVLGNYTIAEENMSSADVNSDSDISIGDVVILNRALLGLVTLNPPREKTVKPISGGTHSSMEISVDSVNVTAGETVDIPVKVSGNKGIAGFAFEVALPEKCTVQSVQSGSILSTGIFGNNGNTCTWYNNVNVSSDGILFILKVKAEKDAESGIVVIKNKDDNPNNLTNKDGETVDSEFAWSTLTVDPAEEEHKHNYQQVEAKASTIEAPGYKAHQVCSDCKDEKDKVIIPQIDINSITLSEDSFVYSGDENKPSVSVKDVEKNILVEGTDFDLTYQDNINAGTANAIITFKGDYSGKVMCEFTIDKAQSTPDVESSNIKVGVKKTKDISINCDRAIKYTSENPKIATVSSTGKVKGVKIGETTITAEIKGDSNHNDTTIKIHVIVPTVISKAVLTKTSYTYNGEVQKPAIKSVNGGTKLVVGKDYKFKYTDVNGAECEPKDAGTYIVEISGIGNCDGNVKCKYTIAQATNTLTAAITESTAYIDKKMPELSASAGDNAKISYAVTSGPKFATIVEQGGKYYVKALKTGTATVTVTAEASTNYKKATKTIKVTVKSPTDINSSKITTVGKVVWNKGKEVVPSVTVKSGKTVFTEGKDYTVKLTNTSGGEISSWDTGETVRVTVDASDENALACRGTFVKDLVIEKAEQPMTASCEPTVYTGEGKGNVKIAFADGEETPSISCVSSKSTIASVTADGVITPIKAGKATITVNVGATKHYAAKTIKLNITVKAATNISSGKLVTVKAGYNAGENVVPVVTVKGFKEGVDFTYEYTDAKNIGDSITVTVKAVEKTGGCIGECTKTVVVGKGDQPVTVVGQPTDVKAKATTDAFEITGVKDNAAVTVSTKTYASINNLGGGKYSVTGIKKGTATVTIKIAATEKYNAKTITFKVKVAK